MIGQNFQRKSDTSVKLDEYISDLNLEISPDGYSCQPLHNDGFAYMWGGCKATYGVRRGKVCFEVKIVENLQVSTSEFTDAHIVRVGWSTDAASLQLGEDKNSFGYGGTAKKSEGRNFSDYGRRFDTGDVIGCYLSIGGGWADISFCVNGYQCGTAFKVRWDADEALFPHVLSKNCRVEINFGQAHNPYFSLLPGYKIIGNLPVEQRVAAISPPTSKEDCEVIIMVGLPGVGKTTWAMNYVKLHPAKKYNILGTDAIIDKMRVQGLPRKNNFRGRWDVLIKQATECFNVMLRKATTRNRNLVLDQTNVYASARKRKVRQYKDAGYVVNAMVLVPTDDDMLSRAKQRTLTEGKEVPEAAVYDMKANFSLPHEDENLFSTITFLELQREDAENLVAQYNIDASLKGYKSNKQSGQGANENQKEISERRRAQQQVNDSKTQPNRYGRPGIPPLIKSSPDKENSFRNDKKPLDSRHDRDGGRGDSRGRSSRKPSDPSARHDRTPERYRGRSDKRREDYERRDKSEADYRVRRDRSRGNSREQHRRESQDSSHDRRREDVRDRSGHARDDYRSKERDRERDEYRKRTRDRQVVRDVNEKNQESFQYGRHENQAQSINQPFFDEERRRDDRPLDSDQWTRRSQQDSSSSALEPPNRQQSTRLSRSHTSDERNINRHPEEYQRYGDFPLDQQFHDQQSTFKSEEVGEKQYPSLMPGIEPGIFQRPLPQRLEWKNNELAEGEIMQNMEGIIRDRRGDKRMQAIDPRSMERNDRPKSLLQGWENRPYDGLMDRSMDQARDGPSVPHYGNVKRENELREGLRDDDGNSHYLQHYNQSEPPFPDTYTTNDYTGRGSGEVQRPTGMRADVMQDHCPADQPGRFSREPGNVASDPGFGPPAQHSNVSNVRKEWQEPHQGGKFYESLSPRLTNVDFEALRATLANVQQAHKEEILSLTKRGNSVGRGRPSDLEHGPNFQPPPARAYKEGKSLSEYDAALSDIAAQQLDVYNAHKKQLARSALPVRKSDKKDVRAVTDRARTDQRSIESRGKTDRRHDEERDEKQQSYKAPDRRPSSRNRNLHFRESQRNSPHGDGDKMSEFSTVDERHSPQRRRRRYDDDNQPYPSEAPKPDHNQQMQERSHRMNEHVESKRQRRTDALLDRMQPDQQGSRRNVEYPSLLSSMDDWNQGEAVENLLAEFPESPAFLHERPLQPLIGGDGRKVSGLLGEYPDGRKEKVLPALMQDFDVRQPNIMNAPRHNAFRPRNSLQRPALLDTPGVPVRQPHSRGAWQARQRPPRPPRESSVHGQPEGVDRRATGRMIRGPEDEAMAYDLDEDVVRRSNRAYDLDEGMRVHGQDIGDMAGVPADDMARGPNGGMLEMPRIRGPRSRPSVLNPGMAGMPRPRRTDLRQPRPRGPNPYMGPHVRSPIRLPRMGPRNMDLLGQGEVGLHFRPRGPWNAPRGMRTRGPRPSYQI